MKSTTEGKRLDKSKEEGWKKWGPYLSERQWGTVREDYSPDGSAWEFVSHEDARSNAYRWGEEGLGGICDNDQRLCVGWSFWNEKDPILKERLFGLSGNEGNHGEDVKEIYYYLDSTPTHSYMKMLYKYPQEAFPYDELVRENIHRDKSKPEFEIIDSGVFDDDRYFDIFIEYAKGDADDILCKVTIHNRGPETANIHALPNFWYRNTWRLAYRHPAPEMQLDENRIYIGHHRIGDHYVYFEDDGEALFTNNETNRERVHNAENYHDYFKDGVNDYVVNGELFAVNPAKKGTKSAVHHKLSVPAGESRTVRFRLTTKNLQNGFDDFDDIFEQRLKEADEFYEVIHDQVPEGDLRDIQRQAYAGLMWSKQYYYYNIKEWLDGDHGRDTPHEKRKEGRNRHWRHLHNEDIISMPDKWEYPWYAAWDLAFHTIPIARIDADFAKDQLLLLLNERYLHPNGQIPAYEWNFGDVNPPVHAWAVLRVFHIDEKQNGKADYDFLEKAFHKLMLNFTWWVNQKDTEGNNIFEGGFLGLDNIGVFDRSSPLPKNGKLEQADATSWMAMFSLNMLRISLDLATDNKVYQDMAIKFFEHFLLIAEAIHTSEYGKVPPWDEEDSFYYDVLKLGKKEDEIHRMKIRSMVGLIPMFAVETLKELTYNKLPEFQKKLDFFQKIRPNLYKLVARWDEEGKNNRRLLSLLRGHRMTKVMEKMLDEEEFLSDFGIRSLSKYHKDHPFQFTLNKEKLEVRYAPGESESHMFGGNSNWRGPIWFPVNYLILESLWKYNYYYDDDFQLEYPTGSGEHKNVREVADCISNRLINIFAKDKDGRRPVYGNKEKFQTDPHFTPYILFYEYFHGDTGEGLGASHQTGWTAVVADIIHKLYNDKKN